MAFVAEDGSGLEGANSLASVKYADEYFADRMNSAWAALPTEAKQAALLRATAYVAGQYNFKGNRANSNQGTPFPRIGVTDPAGNVPQGVPQCVQDVTCELAVRAAAGPLIQDPTLDEGGRPVKMKQLRAGPLHKTIEYAGPGEIITMSRYPAVDALMCPWLLKSELVFAHGVKVTPAEVSGVSVSEMAAVASNPDHYTGPMNENNKDVEKADDGTF